MNRLLTITVRRRAKFSIRKERALQALLGAAIKAADISRDQVRFADAVGQPGVEFVGSVGPDTLRRVIGQNSPDRRLFRMVAALSSEDLAKSREAAAARRESGRGALSRSRSIIR